MYTKCIPHVDRLLYNFYIQNLYKRLPKCGAHFVYILYKFCMHQLHTSCTIFVCKMYTWFLWVDKSSYSLMYISKCLTWCGGNSFLPALYKLRSVSKTLLLTISITLFVITLTEVFPVLSYYERIFQTLVVILI